MKASPYMYYDRENEDACVLDHMLTEHFTPNSAIIVCLSSYDEGYLSDIDLFANTHCASADC